MNVDQTTFRLALLDAAQPVPPGLLDCANAPAGKRFSVYRNNVAVSLTEALQTSFPILRKLLGDQNFDQLAGIFLRAHPPSSPLMMRYGDEMPAFLQGFAPLQHLGYLPDVARLELALTRAYHAADAEPMDPAVLAELPPETLMQARLTCAPSLILLHSDWPLFDLWRFNTAPRAPKPQAVAQDVVILRAEVAPEPHSLSKAEGAWLAAILSGQDFAAAQDAATALTPEFDLTPLLGLLLQSNALTNLTYQDP